MCIGWFDNAMRRRTSVQFGPIEAFDNRRLAAAQSEMCSQNVLTFCKMAVFPNRTMRAPHRVYLCISLSFGLSYACEYLEDIKWGTFLAGRVFMSRREKCVCDGERRRRRRRRRSGRKRRKAPALSAGSSSSSSQR